MESVKFYNGIAITAPELNELQDRKATAIIDRFLDTRSFGVVETKSPSKIVYTDGTTLGIYGITAYDQTGNRIYIAPKDNPDEPAIMGLLLGDQGKLIQGGSKLVPTKTYTMVIRYTEISAPPIAHHVVSAEPYLLYQNASYELYLRDLNTTQEGDVVLATVYCSENGLVSVDESTRSVSTIPSSDVVGTITNASGNTASDTYGNNISFGDHINSIGTGTVSSINPHGLSAADLGIDAGAFANHQKLLHSDGIRSDNLDSTTSALYPYYRNESLTGYDVLYVQPLSASLNEMLIVDGQSVLPSNLPSVFSYSFTGRNNETYAGYYLVSVDVTSTSIVVNGPYASESTDVFVQLLNTPTLFPICSFQWAKIIYEQTGTTDAEQAGSYSIVPATFKDRRVFNNISFANIRPDDLFAMSQFAPIANDIAYIHNARIIGTLGKPMYYNVSGKTLSLVVDGENTQVMFAGANPLPIESIMDQLYKALVRLDSNGNAYYAAYPRITKEGYLSISAPLSVQVVVTGTGNDASELLGFSVSANNTASSDDGLIKEMIYIGDRNGLILFFYNGDKDVTEIDYYLGGGKLRKHLFEYKGRIITHVNEIIEAL